MATKTFDSNIQNFLNLKMSCGACESFSRFIDAIFDFFYFRAISEYLNSGRMNRDGDGDLSGNNSIDGNFTSNSDQLETASEAREYALGSVQSRVMYFEAEIDKLTKSLGNCSITDSDIIKNRIDWARRKRFHNIFNTNVLSTENDAQYEDSGSPSLSINNMDPISDTGELTNNGQALGQEDVENPLESCKNDEEAKWNNWEKIFGKKLAKLSVSSLEKTEIPEISYPWKFRKNLAEEDSDCCTIEKANEANAQFDKQNLPKDDSFGRKFSRSNLSKSSSGSKSPIHFDPVSSSSQLTFKHLEKIVVNEVDEIQQQIQEFDDFNELKNVQEVLEQLNYKLEKMKTAKDEKEMNGFLEQNQSQTFVPTMHDQNQSQAFVPIIHDHSRKQLKNVQDLLHQFQLNYKLEKKKTTEDEKEMNGLLEVKQNQSQEFLTTIHDQNQKELKNLEQIMDQLHQKLDFQSKEKQGIPVPLPTHQQKEANEFDKQNVVKKDNLVGDDESMDEFEEIKTRLNQLNQNIENQVKVVSILQSEEGSQRLESEIQINPLKKVRDTLCDLNLRWESRKKSKSNFVEESVEEASSGNNEVSPTKSTYNLKKLQKVLSILDKLNMKFENNETEEEGLNSSESKEVFKESESSSTAAFLEDFDQLKEVETLLEQLSPTT